jgi:hypothetical protein
LQDEFLKVVKEIVGDIPTEPVKDVSDKPGVFQR